MTTSAIASTRYNVDSPTTGINAPASNGPSTAPNDMTVDPSAPADGKSSAGTSRAIDADRAGALAAKNTCCNPSSPITSHTEPTFSAACAHNSTDETAIPVFVTSSSLRRSTVSAIAPPHSPNTSSGTSATPAAIPTHADEPVRS